MTLRRLLSGLQGYCRFIILKHPGDHFQGRKRHFQDKGVLSFLSFLLKEANLFVVAFKATDCFLTPGFKPAGGCGGRHADPWERFCLMAETISSGCLPSRPLPGIVFSGCGGGTCPGNSGSSIYSDNFHADGLSLSCTEYDSVPNIHYYFPCLEMGIVSALIIDWKDGLISVNTSVGC